MKIDNDIMFGLALVVMAAAIPIAIAFDKPTPQESYNEALSHCASISSLNERNFCRAEVTKVYSKQLETEN